MTQASAAQPSSLPGAGLVPTAFDIPVLRAEGFRRMAGLRWASSPGRRGRGLPPVVCVHGLTRNGRDFDRIAAALAEDQGRTVWCPDVLGRGRSDRLADPAGYTNPLYAGDLATLCATVMLHDGGEGIDWIGTSMGGLVGMILAAMPGSPIRRLVLNDVGAVVPQATLARIASYVGTTPRFDSLDGLEAHLRAVHAPFGRLSDAWWRHMAEHGAWRLAEGGIVPAYDPAIAVPFQAMMAEGGPGGDLELWPLWEAIRCPVLILRGEESDLLLPDTVAEMAHRGPGCRLVEIPGVGHAPTLTDLAQIEPIAAFLAEIE